mgnify:CR=1 FL=1
MSNEYIIKMPTNIAGLSVGATLSFHINGNLMDCNEIAIDLSDTKSCDMESVNSLVSFLCFLRKLYSDKIKIVLPNNKSVALFLYSIGVIDYMFSESLINQFEDINHFLYFYQFDFSASKSKLANTLMISQEEFQNILENELVGLENIMRIYRYDSDYFVNFFYEASNNIFEHSERKFGSFAYQKKSNSFDLFLADVGIGIRNSLIKNSDINPYHDNCYYLELAIKDGISETNEDGRGFGLGQIINTEACVVIASSGAKITTKDGSIKSIEKCSKYFLGTTIKVSIPY